MSKRLDILFREKLAVHEISPREEAWLKIEAGLSSSKRGVVWIRMAAVLLLLGSGAVLYVWLRPSGSEAKTVAHVASAVKKEPKVTAKTEKSFPHKPVFTAKSGKDNVIITRKLQEKASQHEKQDAPVSVIEDTVQLASQSQINEESNQPASAVNDAVKKPIVLTYTLESFSKEERQLVQTEKRNNLQKMVDKAIEVKHADGRMAQLRSLKNDLLSGNFKRNN